MIWQLIEQLPNPHHSSHREHHTHHPSIIPQHRPKPTAHQPIHLTTQSASQPASPDHRNNHGGLASHTQSHYVSPTPTRPSCPDPPYLPPRKPFPFRRPSKDASHVGGGGTLLHVSPAQDARHSGMCGMCSCSCDGTGTAGQGLPDLDGSRVHVHGTYCYLDPTREFPARPGPRLGEWGGKGGCEWTRSPLASHLFAAGLVWSGLGLIVHH